MLDSLCSHIVMAHWEIKWLKTGEKGREAMYEVAGAVSQNQKSKMKRQKYTRTLFKCDVFQATVHKASNHASHKP